MRWLPRSAPIDRVADSTPNAFDAGLTAPAVSHIQGKSLSPSDAEFAVRTVLQLRCPGYLP